MDFQILSVQEMNFNDKKTGEPVCLYKCFLLMDDGGVASVTSRVCHAPGDLVSLRIAAGFDGKLAVKVVE